MIWMISYIVFVLLANWLATVAFVPILPWWGISAPLGSFLIGPVFTIRDAIDKWGGGRAVWCAIGAASSLSYALSWILGAPLLGRITIASMVTFLFSESMDWLVYKKLGQHGWSWVKQAWGSNLLSSLLDSALFISWAFGPAWQPIVGQYLVKVVISGIFIYLVKAWRTLCPSDSTAV